MGDIEYMKLALKEAEKGRGHVEPNPVCGCVIVKKDTIVGRGYHKKFGSDHAEVVALKQAGAGARGATAYVTLEPCNHYGKTPPCTEAFIMAGVSRVVVALKDANPHVKGGGISRLRKAHFTVTTGVLEKEARIQNRIFITNVTHNRPYVALKVAESLDGCTADDLHRAKWITGPKAREHGNRLRGNYAAIVAGANTIIADNPRLTLRTKKGKSPIRIIIDPHLRTPASSFVYQDPTTPTLLVTQKTSQSSLNPYKTNNTQIVFGAFRGGKLDIRLFLKELYNRSIFSLLIEGGLHTWSAFLNAKCVDECFIYVAPKIIGSTHHVWYKKEAILKDALPLQYLHTEKIEDDILIHGFLNMY